jgi:Zn ribbon nucleic-acid-binding protein
MMKTRITGYENTSLAVECPACREFNETPLSHLETADHVDCETCGMLIDVEQGPVRSQINRLLEHCLLMDAQFGGQ